MALLAIVLVGCLPWTVPSQKHPSCSWGSQPPPNASAVCRLTFSTLSGIAAASMTGEDARIERLVSNRTVQRRIIGFGSRMRSQGHFSAHVVPSITLAELRHNYFGAGFFLAISTRFTKVRSPQTVYLIVSKGKAVVVQDQPGEDW